MSGTRRRTTRPKGSVRDANGGGGLARLTRVALVLAAAAALPLWAAACGGDDGTGPSAQPGTLVVEATRNSGPDGAAFQLTVSGGPIDTARVADSSHQFYSELGSDQVEAVVIGTVTSGNLVEIDVPDLNDKGSYTVQLDELADTNNDLVATGNYSLTLTEK